MESTGSRQMAVLPDSPFHETKTREDTSWFDPGSCVQEIEHYLGTFHGNRKPGKPKKGGRATQQSPAKQTDTTGHDMPQQGSVVDPTGGCIRWLGWV